MAGRMCSYASFSILHKKPQFDLSGYLIVTAVNRQYQNLLRRRGGGQLSAPSPIDDFDYATYVNDLAFDGSDLDFSVDSAPLFPDGNLSADQLLFEKDATGETTPLAPLPELSINVGELSYNPALLPDGLYYSDDLSFSDLTVQLNEEQDMAPMLSSANATPADPLSSSPFSQKSCDASPEPATPKSASMDRFCHPQASKEGHVEEDSAQLVCLQCPLRPAFQQRHEYT
ncbi:MAG: hypothetical protein Q9160_008842 [Pyrenula sp. 1 TL-2023]